MNKYEQLTIDLMEAKKAAIKEKERNDNDGGTCNFDTCVLILKGWNKAMVEKAAENAGVKAYKWDNGHYHIVGYQFGQADLHTRMAETFEKVMASKGYNTTMYYAMD